MKNKQLQEDIGETVQKEPMVIDGAALLEAVMLLMEWDKPDSEGFGAEFDEDWYRLKELVENL